MPLYLLDTNHACRLLDPEDALWKRLDGSADSAFALPLPTVAELSYMVERSHRRASNSERLQALLLRLWVLPFTEAAQRTGDNLSAIDTQIAAVALEYGAVLLTSDSDFEAIPGLARSNWLT